MSEAKTSRRKNLAFELLDKDKQAACLHPHKWTTLKLIKRCFKEVFERPKLTAAYFLYMLTAGLLPVLDAFSIYYITDWMSKWSKTASPSGTRELFLFVGCLSLAYFFLQAVSSLLESKIKIINNYLRTDKIGLALEKQVSMDLGIYRNNEIWTSFGNYFGAVNSPSQGICGIYLSVLHSLAFLLSLLLLSIFLFRIHWGLPLFALVSGLLSSRLDNSYADFKRQQEAELEKKSQKSIDLTRLSADFAYGKDIRVFRMRAAFMDYSRILWKSQALLLDKRASFRRKNYLPIALLSSASLLASLALVVNTYLKGGISFTETVTSLSITAAYISLFLQLNQQISTLHQEGINVGNFFDMEDASLEPSGGRDLPLEDFSSLPEIRLENVSFSYPGTEKKVIDRLNLTIPGGSSLALVGVNGAGKTTLMSLLTGLYQPTEGRILIDGVDNREISFPSLCQLFSVVLQKYEPLALTVAENIAASTENIDRKRVESVLERVGLGEIIEKLPEGIDCPMTRVMEEDGLVLSGGQAQKFQIARALYREDSPILILDEPTAALDALAEEKIYRDFQEMSQGKTAIFISHRLASTRFCDRIAVLDGGRISQTGSHEELMKEKGLYQEMYETQASYYQEKKTDKEGQYEL